MTTPTASTASASLRSDEPIREFEQDKLARARFVDVIGQHILDTNAPESVVIALNAPWGAGKSSFLNLLQQRLAPPRKEEGATKAVADTPPIIVRFNPWHYTNVDQLVRMFFGELARGIGTARQGELGKKIGELLRAAGSMAAIFSSGAGELLKDAGSALKDEKSLPELKHELDELLPDLAQRVVVFVDDIDRLERDTLRLLFRMIRLNADFPNVTYVLAFDRLVVERHLDEEKSIRGRDYLEKIIQVAFDIPEPERQTLRRILFAEMHTVLESMKTRPLDQHRWGNVFNSGFEEHFRTIRHIKRYVNGLRLTLPPVALDVDLVDFLAVEVLRVFHPEVYFGVVRGKDTLAPPLRHADGISGERLKEWVENLCAKASPGFDGCVREILRQLFPELARAYTTTTYAPAYYLQWRRDCRVCAPEIFDRFFLLALPEGEISEIEMQAFLDLLSDPAKMKDYLRAAKESGKARRLMERLEDFTEDLPIENASRLVSVLFDEGDGLRFESAGFLDFTADLQVARIISQCLLRMPSEERHALFLQSVKSGVGLYTLVQQVSLSEPKDEEIEGRLVFARPLWEPLRDAAVVRTRAAHASAELWKVQRLPYVLFRWLEWTSVAEVRAAVSQHVTADARLLEFLKHFVTESHSYTMGDKVGRKGVHIGKKDIGRLLNLDDLLGRLRAITERGGEEGITANSLTKMLEKESGYPTDD